MSPLVFAIRTQFVRRLLGEALPEKGVEYRTRRPNVAAGEIVLIYETAPTSAIVATAVVGEIYDGSVESIWEQTSAVGGISHAEYMRYFEGRTRAVAIRLTTTRLPEPARLPAGMAPPQSWARWKGEWPPQGMYREPRL